MAKSTHMPINYNKKAQLKVENLAQTTFKLSPINFHAPWSYVKNCELIIRGKIFCKKSKELPMDRIKAGTPMFIEI